MNISVWKGQVSGTVSAPSSKSILQRYLIAGLLADGISIFKNATFCNDSAACLFNIAFLGADATVTKTKPLAKITGVNGKIKSTVPVLACSESGFSLRTLAFVAALSREKITVVGDGSLRKRPIDFFEKIFPQLGVRCKTKKGFLPMEIQGPVKFKNISVDGSQSSQYLSGLLMIYPLAKKDHVIKVTNLKSKKYIDLTLQVLADFGIKIKNDNYKTFYIKGNQTYKACKANIEGDWSAASFLLVAGATSGLVTVTNLSADSLQPDKAIVDVLKNAGADVSIRKNSIIVKTPRIQITSKLKAQNLNPKPQTSNLQPFSFDATDCPDLFPPLVALAMQCNGTSELTGVERLIHKESNRAVALQQEFSKLNKNIIKIEGNKMIINGGLKLKSSVCDSHNDHRIAMALAVAALNVEGGIQINGCEAVKKSYPDFFSDIDKLREK